MNRFYILLDGKITQEKAETSIREHMAPHKIEFKKTEWFSTFESMWPSFCRPNFRVTDTIINAAV
jgi:hypothetical protein